MRGQASIAFVALAALVLTPVAGRAKPCGRGRGGPGCGAGIGMDRGGPHDVDHMGFHYLLAHREQIRRAVTRRPDGVETLTESDDPAVADGIRTHVRAMKARLEQGRPIHVRDPLFAAIFQNAHAIAMRIEDTAQGARVTETSSDPWVAKLVQAHAEVVNGFLANGMAEMHRDHAVPPRP
jgi:hypothetical protein